MLQKEFLNHVENQLEEQLREAIAVFQNLPEASLLKPAPNNGWSIAECIAHLNSYAEFYNPRIEEAIKKAPILEESVNFKHSLIGAYFINSMDARKRKKKYKALERHQPVDIGNPYEIVSVFIQNLEKLLALLQKSGNKNLRKYSVQTSISRWIKINIGDAVQFLLTHNRRHLDQAKRNL